jgi:NAD(P)-dependent dehydrogenase (short-subunit alcohol dehydrogenase family)
MNGKVIVVTGASGALGKVVVTTALARGVRVAGLTLPRKSRPRPTESNSVASI